MRVWPVNHQKIDEGQTELLQAFVDRTLEIAQRQTIEPDFGGDKDILALEAGAAQGIAQTLADFALIAVHLRGVEVPVAELQRRLDQLDAKVLLQRHGAETEHWNARAVRFNDVHS